MFIGVVGFYYNFFSYLEGIGILDIDNEIYIFCLYYVYFFRINNYLYVWKEGWIRKLICIENSMILR